MGKRLMEVESFDGTFHEPGELTQVEIKYDIDGRKMHRWALYLTPENVEKVAEQFEAWGATEPELLPEERLKERKLTTEERISVRRWHWMHHHVELSMFGRLPAAKVVEWMEAGRPKVTKEDVAAAGARVIF